jgi:dsDNA-binding SOS-regulon protein
MSQMVSIADYLRGQLVQGIPQIDEDKTEAQSFAAAINGDITSFDVRKATTYLEDLVGRNR